MTLLGSAATITWPLLVMAVVGFLLCRLRAWLAFLCMPLAAFFGSWMMMDMYGPSV